MKITLTVFFTLFYSVLWAKTPIKVTGNSKTETSIITSLSQLENKASIRQEDIDLALRRLLNTGLFSDVEINQNGKVIIIKVQERWTTIPILKFSSGGGVGQATVGVFDPNIGGKYIEAGGQYTRLDETNSGVTWLKVPRVSNSNWGIDLQLWKINRLRTKYDQVSDDAIVKTGFLQTREKVYTALSYEIDPDLTFKVSYEFNGDKFSDDLVPAEAKNIIRQEGLPARSKVHLAGFELAYANLVDNGLTQNGLAYSLLAKAAFTESNQIQNFFLGEFNLRYYKTLFKKSTFAFRLNTGFTNTNILQYWYYIGGLDKIRGFADNRFAGRYFWLANSEFRHPVISKDLFTIQAVTFLDLATTAERIKTYSSLQAASVGAGFRIILPKLYRFVLRVDYAKPIKRDDDNIFSFGVQQFF